MDDFETAKQFFVEGLRLLEAENFPAAETQFARSLELIPDRVSTLNNLAAIKIRLNKFSEAEALALKAIALEDKSSEAWLNLGMALTGMKRHEEALPAYDRAVHRHSSNVMAQRYLMMTLLKLKRFDEALLACDRALNSNSSQYEFLYTKSLILKELKRTDEAQKIYLKSIEMRVALSPVTMTKRCATQKADVLIICRNPDIDDSLRSFEALHLNCTNFPGQLAQRFHEDFRFAFVFAGDAADPSARKQIPQPDIVINNHANGELLLSGGGLSELIWLFDSFGVPVVNHPTQAVQTTRDASARLLNGISGIRVPKTMRFSSVGKTREELVGEIEAQYDYPLIARTLAMQNGMGMTKTDSRDALVGVLSSGWPETFFVTEFVDSRGGDKFFRKIRAAIVKDEIIICRVDYNANWNTHGQRRSEKGLAFYSENRYLLDEEKQICAHPEEQLGRSAIQSLRAIRERIPMDVFGVDFNVDADGLLVFYEANATMNLFSTARKEISNPQAAEDHLKLAFQRYLTSLVARH